VSRPKKILLWFCAVLAALLALCLLLILFKNPLLRAYAVHEVERETGAPASIGSFHLDLSSGRGRSLGEKPSLTLHIKDFELGNPPGFPDESGLLLRIPELYLRVDRAAASEGILRLEEARVNISELNIIKNAAGQTNIFELEKHSRLKRKKKKKKRDQMTFAGVGELRVSLGTLRYSDLANPTNNHEFVIGIDNEVVTTIKNDDDLETWAKAMLVRITIQQAIKQAQQGGKLRDMLRKKSGNDE
jgi:uncharacterized protein involved in outer membrane biogenesis